ncbi:MAG: phospholipid methyltransferase [Acidobacteria bacterium]|nr:MAG: phospholipid methyltransferase [Acidobacteriota bacterium]
MGRITAIRSLGLYAPILTAFIIAIARPRMPSRMLPAALLGFLWTLPSLLALQLLNLRFGWWDFHVEGALFRGMPLDQYIGWAVLWGLVPILGFRKIAVWWEVALFLTLDLILMPACSPLLELRHYWLIGEFVGLCVVLIPSQLLARWTLNDTHLKVRATLQVFVASGVFLSLIPEIVFALRRDSGWGPLLSQTTWIRNFELQAVLLLGILGLSAVQEFAERGQGTPIPYDPPKYLVVSGFYRYIANPMQLSCVLVMIAWSLVLKSPWLALAGAVSFFYSLGLAAWDEGEDMKLRFGTSWLEYRKNVRPWRFRLQPWHRGDRPQARLYVAESCSPCSEVRRWFDSKNPVALVIVAAEDHPARDLQRMTYDPMDGGNLDEGVRAFARGLEHINLGWAFVAACLRLPGISHFVQILIDASGLGPHMILRRSKAGLSSID